MGSCNGQGQPTLGFQAHNIQNQNENQFSKEDRYLNFDSYIKYKSEYVKAQISNDEKFLAVKGRKLAIYIYYLKNKKIIKIIRFDKEISIQIIKFSNNSRYLLFGDKNGYLFCYDIDNNFKIIYNQKVHSNQISDIFTIDDEQIMTCSYGSLIITNIKYNYNLFKIEHAFAERDFEIQGIDFDRSNDFIICCSYYSIKFFNRKDGKCQIEQRNAHKSNGDRIQMIQLISEDNNLISSNCHKLILWQIDYRRLQLKKLKRFNKNMYNFTSVFNNNKIVVVCEEYVVILGKDLVILQLIKHNIQIGYYIQTRQLNSLNYIIIPGADNLSVQKKVRKLWK